MKGATKQKENAVKTKALDAKKANAALKQNRKDKITGKKTVKANKKMNKKALKAKTKTLKSKTKAANAGKAIKSKKSREGC